MRNRLTWAVLFAATAFAGGCCGLANPVPDAIPVRRLPDEVLHAPVCPPSCDTVVQVNKPATGSPAATRQIVRTKAETKADDNLPLAPLASNAEIVPLVACAGPGCGSCAVFY